MEIEMKEERTDGRSLNEELRCCVKVCSLAGVFPLTT